MASYQMKINDSAPRPKDIDYAYVSVAPTGQYKRATSTERREGSMSDLLSSCPKPAIVMGTPFSNWVLSNYATLVFDRESMSRCTPRDPPGMCTIRVRVFEFHAIYALSTNAPQKHEPEWLASPHTALFLIAAVSSTYLLASYY